MLGSGLSSLDSPLVLFKQLIHVHVGHLWQLYTINTLRFLLSIRSCVTDVGVAITNLRVVCKIITCVSALTFTELEMATIILIFLEIVKTAAKLLLQVWTLCVAGYAKDAIVGAYHRTSDGQEHKIIGRARLERDTIFNLRVTACREQGSHCHD